MYKKFLFGAILSAAVCMSACKKETELIDDFTATDARTEVNYVTEQSVTKAGRTDGTPEIVINPEGVNGYETDAEEKKVISLRQYYEERGFKDFYAPYRGYESYGLTLDLNDFKDGDDPFEGIDREHIETIDYLTLENIDGRDLNFLLRFEENYVDITVADYSGSADFGFYPQINANITFDNYMGGDLSTLDGAKNYRVFTVKNYSGEYPLKGMDKCGVTSIWFEDYDEDVDFGFLADCPNIESVFLDGKSADAEVLAELLETTDISLINVTVKDFSAADSDMLMKAAGSKSAAYSLDDSEWSYENLPTEGLVFYTSFDVIPGYPEEKWESRTGEADSNYLCFQNDGERYGLWEHHGSLVCRFSNFTDKPLTADSVSIFKNDGVQLTPMEFLDGSTEKKIDFTVQANGNADFDVNEEIFDFGSCEAGVYTVAFDFDGEKYEQMFFAETAYDEADYENGYKNYNKITLDFLTDEQNEVFRKANEVTEKYFGCSAHLTQEYIDGHTTEDFLAPICEAYTYDYAYSQSLGRYINENGELAPIDGDRGGDITLRDAFFTPVYLGEDEVIFKVTGIHGHEDDQYHVWFEESNFHMVKTDEGWRFDKFSLWY